MANILSTPTARIEEYLAELINTVEADRPRGCESSVIGEKARSYAEAVRSLLADVAAKPEDVGRERFDRELQRLESAYAGWKTLDRTFDDTLQMAYGNSVPRKNLLLDQIHAELRQSVGDPLADRYIQTKALWREHLADRPWDAYREATSTHLDTQSLDDCLNALIRGDDLDVEDALVGLTGKLRHAFIDFVHTNPDSVVDLEPGLWKRPEIVVAADYWSRGRSRRVVDVLRDASSPRFARAFGTLQSLFKLNHGAATTPKSIAEEIERIQPEHRERFYRCLMLHPDYEMRRFAAGNSNMISVWKALTPPNVPCATILTVLEQLSGSNTYSTGHRKLFFDTVYRRLMNVTSRSDVLYTRGIVRILTKLDFFLEDEYFAKFMALIDYLEEKEKIFKIDDSTMNQYTDALKREKQRIGNVETTTPDFDDVPMVILRKLARDGHFWELLAMHPIVKIAKEVVPHVASRERATVIACNHRVNQEVLRAIGKRRSLFPTLRAKLTLLGNPRTPPGVSMEYLTDLSKKDIERLLRQPGIHPELRTMLRNQFNRRKL